MLGEPVTVVERVMIKPSGAANYAVSRQGTLLYVPGGVGVRTRRGRSCGSTGKGHEEPIKAPLRDYGAPRISPDGTRLVVDILESGEHRHLDLGSRAARR